MKQIALFAGLCVALGGAPSAHAEPPVVYKIDAAHSRLSYKIVHKFHEVVGVSKQVQAAVALKPGEAQVQIRVPVKSFDSGNDNRDAHMKETVEAAKFPFVMLKGLAKGFALPAKLPATVSTQLEGSLTFHGITHPIAVPVTVAIPDAAHLHVTTAFDVSLDAYKVERPSLMFIKIDDACHIEADLTLAR